MAQTLTQEDLDAILATINSGKPFVTLADGVAHGGTPGSSTATIAAQVLNVSNPTVGQPAVLFSSDSPGGGGAFRILAVDSSAALMVSGSMFIASGLDINRGVVIDGIGERAALSMKGNGESYSTLEILSGSATDPVIRIDGTAAYSGTAGGLPILIETDNEDGIKINSGPGKHDVNLAGSGDILGNLAGTIDGLTAAGLATLDSLLVESSISAGVGLTDDAGTQLTSINLRQALALILSTLAGALAGAAGTSVAIKPGGKPSGNTRVAATVDSDGNRSALTLKVPT